MRLGAARTQQFILVVLMATAVAFWMRSYKLVYPGNVFPRAVIVVIFVLSFLNLFVKPGSRNTSSGSRGVQTRDDADHVVAPVIVGLSSALLYFLAIIVMGFYIATLFYLVVLFELNLDRHRPSLHELIGGVVGAGALTALLYVGFTVALGVQMPGGMFSF